jgi:hypothetical protein
MLNFAHMPTGKIHEAQEPLWEASWTSLGKNINIYAHADSNGVHLTKGGKGGFGVVERVWHGLS